MPDRTEQLFPLYRITEWRDGSVFRTEPAGEAWLPIDTKTGSELPDGRRVGTPDSFQVRRVVSAKRLFLND